MTEFTTKHYNAKYPWGSLNEIGDHFFVEGKTAQYMASIIKSKLKALGPGTVIRGLTNRSGVLVILTDLPFEGFITKRGPQLRKRINYNDPDAEIAEFMDELLPEQSDVPAVIEPVSESVDEVEVDPDADIAEYLDEPVEDPDQ